MGYYFNEGHTNWDFDRKRRKKVHEIFREFKKSVFPSQSISSKPNTFPVKGLWFLKTARIIGVIIKIGLIPMVFYAFYMIITHGKVF